MEYSETLKWLFSQLPIYQNTGTDAYKPGLGNATALDARFGHPHKLYRTVHIAGTNGKGSVAHMLASVFQEAGFKTGLYTSPHLKDFRERIKINGTMIPCEFVTRFTEENMEFFEKLQPSFFEMTSAMAFTWFAKERVDIAVIETGLGGRLDSTNIITPVLSVITGVALDHTAILGDTTEKIAFEKAGIIKPGVPAVVGRYDNGYAHVFTEKASETHSQLTFASEEWRTERLGEGIFNAVRLSGDSSFCNLHCELAGEYQTENIATVLEALYVLCRNGIYISETNITDGIAKVVKNTGLLGRWQKIGDNPLTICDTGHNPDGFRHIVKQLSEYSCDTLRIVFGMAGDKDAEGVLAQLPRNASYYFCKAFSPRSADPEAIAQKASVFGLKGAVFPSVAEALEAACRDSGEKDMIFVGGSTFVVAEVI